MPDNASSNTSLSKLQEYQHNKLWHLSDTDWTAYFNALWLPVGQRHQHLPWTAKSVSQDSSHRASCMFSAPQTSEFMWKLMIQVCKHTTFWNFSAASIVILNLNPCWLFSVAAPTCNVIKPTISLDPHREDDRFKAFYSLVDYMTDRNSKSHYLGAYKQVVHFVIDLGCVVKISTVNLRNSFNGGAQGGQGRWVAGSLYVNIN